MSSTSSQPQQQEKKRVHFNTKQNKIVTVLCRDSFTKKEQQRYWYTAKDDKSTKTQRRKLLEQLECNETREGIYYRGLERWTSSGLDQLYADVYKCVDSVMDEQDAQWTSKQRMEEPAEARMKKIASTSQSLTRANKHKARKFALEDEQEAKQALALPWNDSEEDDEEDDGDLPLSDPNQDYMETKETTPTIKKDKKNRKSATKKDDDDVTTPINGRRHHRGRTDRHKDFCRQDSLSSMRSIKKHKKKQKMRCSAASSCQSWMNTSCSSLLSTSTATTVMSAESCFEEEQQVTLFLSPSSPSKHNNDDDKKVKKQKSSKKVKSPKKDKSPKKEKTSPKKSKKAVNKEESVTTTTTTTTPTSTTTKKSSSNKRDENKNDMEASALNELRQMYKQSGLASQAERLELLILHVRSLPLDV